jgi:hypothetical protein
VCDGMQRGPRPRLSGGVAAKARLTARGAGWGPGLGAGAAVVLRSASASAGGMAGAGSVRGIACRWSSHALKTTTRALGSGNGGAAAKFDNKLDADEEEDAPFSVAAVSVVSVPGFFGDLRSHEDVSVPSASVLGFFGDLRVPNVTVPVVGVTGDGVARVDVTGGGEASSLRHAEQNSATNEVESHTMEVDSTVEARKVGGLQQ